MAAAITGDPDHVAARELLEDHPGPLVTTAMVVAEAAYLIEKKVGPRAEAALHGPVVLLP